MRTEDGYIIHKCLNGEPEAFGFLVDKYKASIYAFAYTKVSDFRDAEDVTQEVFIKAYEKLRTLRRWDSVLAWLYAIASNRCKNLIRSRRNRPDGEFIEDQEPVDMAKPSMDSYRENLALESIREALELLPETYSQVLTLHYFGGMTCKEIATFLRTSPVAIKKRLSRARSQLKAEVLAMMSTTYSQQKLQASFTFRIVEIVKRTKIRPVPPMHKLPWGLSLATGIVFTVLSFYPQLFPSINPIVTPAGLLPGEAKVSNAGEIPVYILKTPEIPFLVNQQGNSGGGDGNTPDSQNALFLAPQAEGGTWSKRTDMPAPKGGLAVVAVNEKIYTIGGTTDGGDIVSTIEEYDPLTDKWTKKANMPTARWLLAASAVDGKIYAIGGWAPGGICLIVEEYDPVKDKWTRKADMPTARGYLSVSAVDGKIYAIGGMPTLPKLGASFLSTVEEYDPVADEWIRKADMPTARCLLSTSVVNGKIYAIGGTHHRHGSDDYTGLSTVEEYDPVTDKWMKKADMPTARCALATSVLDGKIYAVGGSDRLVKILPTAEEYDPATDTWTKKTNMPTARAGLGSCMVNGKIYAIGGQQNKMPPSLSTLEEYTPEGRKDPKSVSPTGKLPTKWGQLRTENLAHSDQLQ